MPELPEVETVVRDMNKKTIGHTIQEVEIVNPVVIKQNEPERFVAGLAGEIIDSVVRRGKYIIFNLRSSKKLVVHLRMTGQLVQTKKEEERQKHLCLVLSLAKDKNELELRYYDIRKFGFIGLLQPGERLNGIDKLGVEPLEDGLTIEYLKDKLLKRKQKIKALLLEQEIIAGIGNIYADEILFRAKIHPERTGDSLNGEDIENLVKLVPDVLREAIKHRGTTISDYRDGLGKKGEFQNFLRVYGKGGEECPVCRSVLQKTKVAGRTSTFCPKCQK